MTDLMWDKIEKEFRHNTHASVVTLKITRPATVERPMHYFIHDDDPKYASGWLMHEDEFGDLFGSKLTTYINSGLRVTGEVRIQVALEVL